MVSQNRPPRSPVPPNTPACAPALHTPVPTPVPLPRSTRPEPETRYYCHPAARRKNRPLSGPRNRLRLPHLPADASLPPTRINEYKILKRIHHMQHTGNIFPDVIQSVQIRITYVQAKAAPSGFPFYSLEFEGFMTCRMRALNSLDLSGGTAHAHDRLSFTPADSNNLRPFSVSR